MNKIEKLYLYILGLPKTILFNLRYLPLIDAIKLPVFISHRVWLMKLSGKIKVDEVRTGIIKIGFGDVGIFDQQRSRTIWRVSESGFVEFKGKANIGHGSKLSVSGKLVIGKNLIITAESSVVVENCITIGDNVLVSWDSLIMDTDFHKIYDLNGDQTNIPMQIIIGNKVWIGCRTIILKGVKIADGVVIAASSTVIKSININNSIAGGNPARVIKENIKWQPH